MGWYSHDETLVVGKVGKDAEMKYLNNGNAVTNFSIAVDRSYKDRDGELHKRTIWYRITCYGKLAEVVKDVKKGDTILAGGNLEADWQTGSPRIWTKQDGSAGSSFELNAQTIKFLSKREQTETPVEDDAPF